MWTRAELKSRAKAALKGRYWESVAAVLIFGVITVVGSLLVSWIPVLGYLLSLALTFFLINPMTVGLDFYFMQSRLASPVIGNLFFAFSGDRYSKIVGATAWKTLFLFLWALIPAGGVAIILTSFIASMLPGYMLGGSFSYSSIPAGPIIVMLIVYIAGMVVVLMKQIAYSMVEFILTDNPHIGYDRALKLSIAMTYGHKWNIFVLCLSFIGWYLLAILTLYIGLIFLTPYIQATLTELYVRLRDEAIRNGLTTPQELNLVLVGGPPQEQQDNGGAPVPPYFPPQPPDSAPDHHDAPAPEGGAGDDTPSDAPEDTPPSEG
jgi:uncharacterized membrane protein